VIVRLRIQGINKDFPNNWEIIYLPTSSLEYNKVVIVRPTSKSGVRPILEIKPYECDYFQKNFFPEAIQTKSKNKELTLDDVMQLKPETKSEFQIMMLGTDEFSGARKFFESKIFDKNDIVYGSFDKNGLEVKRE